jgi:deoxyadenosine/deoxycytidine kinase
MSPIVISIEGNIGGGKTTMIRHLQRLYPDYHIINEPVDEWLGMTDKADGKSLLEKFYADKTRWSYTFQNAAFITRFTAMKSAIEKCKDSKKVFITERSVLTDRYVFAEMLRDSGDLNSLEWDLYCKWFDCFVDNVPIAGIVKINTDFQTCSDRIKARNRKGEDMIPLDYLEALHKYHDKWLQDAHLPVLEISSEPEELAKIPEFIESLRK